MTNPVIWQASDARKAGLNLTGFIAWLNGRGHSFAGYADLHRWSITDLAGFWGAIRDYFGLILEGDPNPVLTDDPMPRTRWLPGAQMNYAEHVLRLENVGDPARVMLHHVSELRPMAAMSWAEVGGLCASWPPGCAPWASGRAIGWWPICRTCRKP